MTYTTLISADQLQSMMHAGQPLRVFDASFELMNPAAGELQYQDAHIPGAVYAHLDTALSAKGEVYGLKKLADFAGPYGEVRMGWAAGDMGSARLWLHNAKGFYLKLEGTRQGLQVAAGAEGVIITME